MDIFLLSANIFYNRQKNCELMIIFFESTDLLCIDKHFLNKQFVFELMNIFWIDELFKLPIFFEWMNILSIGEHGLKQ